MTEALPLHDGQKYSVCKLCPANVVREGREVCDESLLNDFSDYRKVSRYRPHECPKNKRGKPISQGSAEAILKAQLKTLGR